MAGPVSPPFEKAVAGVEEEAAFELLAIAAL